MKEKFRWVLKQSVLILNYFRKLVYFVFGKKWSDIILQNVEHNLRQLFTFVSYFFIEPVLLLPTSNSHASCG